MTKPSDWVDDAMMDDPEEQKSDDWVEEKAPWLSSVPKRMLWVASLEKTVGADVAKIATNLHDKPEHLVSQNEGDIKYDDVDLDLGQQEEPLSQEDDEMSVGYDEMNVGYGECDESENKRRRRRVKSGTTPRRRVKNGRTTRRRAKSGRTTRSRARTWLVWRRATR
mmetsp:Transcript_146020/g.364094  ORF Transcript_146020/g.364094 Transcript_146020/m.364094 type:complete len:166 (-) Transcript_146020:688-1185(-)